MIMISKRAVLLAKVETTYGTDSSPTAIQNSLHAIDVQIKETTTPVERPVQQASFSNLASLLGVRFAEVTFKLELKGSGTAGTAPRLGHLLRACGVGETILSSTSVTYAPLSTSISSVTLYLYKDGRLHIITGCYGTFSLTCEAGKQAMFEFTFSGIYAAPSTASIPTTVGMYESSTPPVCKNQTFQYNSKTTLVTQTVTLDIANEVSQRPSLAASDAIAGFVITGRKPMVTINPEAQFETSYAFRTDVLATQRQVSLTIGSICTLTVPKFNITDIAYSSRDGVEIETLTGQAAQNTGDDEFTLVFTG